MSDPTPALAGDEVVDFIARRFHETYERLGPRYGWESQESARGKSYDDLPEDNRALLRATVSALLEGGAIEAGPAVVETFQPRSATDAS